VLRHVLHALSVTAVLCASAMRTPAGATDPGAAMALSEGAAQVTSDAFRAARNAAQDGWEAVVERPPELLLPPRPVRVPKPKPVARPQPPAQPRPQLSLSAWQPQPRHALTGIASFYWQGQQTASGEPFNKRDLTAAHKTLPFGTRVRVHCKTSGRDVVVRINDRGPFKPGRVIDLSEAAAEVIGMQGRGLTAVQLTVLKR
jgi:rare lipoprotein A (peptidoglycan hydrolase)